MTDSIIEKLKNTFATADELKAEDLAEIYTPDVTFVDPLGTVEGLFRLTHYMGAMYRNVTSCRFDYLDEVRAGNKAVIKWDMTMKHRKLNGGDEVVVRGLSLLEFDKKIFYQEDVYDVGAAIYENVPLLGSPVRWLKKRAHDSAFKDID